MRRRKKQDLEAEREKRSRIDAERVRTLAERIERNRSKLSKYNRQFGDVEGRLRGLEEELDQARDIFRKAEKKAKLNEAARLRSAVAEDLRALASGALSTLKAVYVQRVSEQMNDLFLDIVGADPSSESAVFTKVTINNRFDIVIHTQDGENVGCRLRTERCVTARTHVVVHMGADASGRASSPAYY